MNSRERVNAALSREMPDRVPVDLSWGLTPSFYNTFKEQTGKTNFEEYFGVDTRLIGLKPTQNLADYSKYYEGRENIQGLVCNEWGIGAVKSKNTELHFDHIISPLLYAKSVNDIIDYPLPDYNADYRVYDWK